MNGRTPHIPLLIIIGAISGCSWIKVQTAEEANREPAQRAQAQKAERERKQAALFGRSSDDTKAVTAERPDPREEARQLVRAADTRDPCDHYLDNIPNLQKARQLWPEVPNARVVEANYRLTCDTGGHEICHLPDAERQKEVYQKVMSLLEEEQRLYPDNARATELLEKARAMRAEYEQAVQAASAYEALSAKLYRKHSGFSEFPTAPDIVSDLRHYKNYVVDFCVADVDGSITALEIGEKTISFELWSEEWGRYRFTGPRILESGEAYDFREYHFIARIEGVVHALTPAGVRVSVPTLRILSFHDNRARFIQAK